VQADHNPKHWNLSLEHPSGMTWKGSFHGDGNTVQVALTQMMMDKEHEYRNETARGHRPGEAMLRDPNTAVDEFGDNLAAPITPRR
jgi:hypothetical protein